MTEGGTDCFDSLFSRSVVVISSWAWPDEVASSLGSGAGTVT